MSPPMSIDRSARTLVRADANTTRADRRWRSVAGAFGIAAIVLFAQRALGEERKPPPARPSPVTLADVGSRATTTKLGNITDLLRRDVESELAAIDWTKSRVNRRYVVSASVVRLDSELRDAGLLASCTVSATLRDERGAILAVLEGRARAEESPGAAARAERDALTVAVRGAITAIPEAIRRMQ